MRGKGGGGRGTVEQVRVVLGRQAIQLEDVHQVIELAMHVLQHARSLSLSTFQSPQTGTKPVLDKPLAHY